MHTGEISSFRNREKRYIRPDGSTVWVDLAVASLSELGEPSTFFVSVVEDITERRNAEQALRESTQHLLTVARCLPDMIWSMDLSGRFTYVSPSAERMLGWTVDEMSGRNWTDISMPRLIARISILLKEEFERAASPDYDRGRILSFECEQVRKDGTTFWSEGGRHPDLAGGRHHRLEAA